MRMFWSELPVYSEEYLKVTDITPRGRKTRGEIGDTRGHGNHLQSPRNLGHRVNEPDPELWQDLLGTYKRLVPLRAEYAHNAKYRGDPPRGERPRPHLEHLDRPSVSVPIRGGKLLLGTWQAVLYFESDGGKRRRLTCRWLGNNELRSFEEFFRAPAKSNGS